MRTFAEDIFCFLLNVLNAAQIAKDTSFHMIEDVVIGLCVTFIDRGCGDRIEALCVCVTLRLPDPSDPSDFPCLAFLVIHGPFESL
jgi:hypothetical protein